MIICTRAVLSEADFVFCLSTCQPAQFWNTDDPKLM